MNGAQQGVAGFGLGVDPIKTALLYDPTLPIGQRISILNTTIVARMYHSEAILLQDGRILVSGSDPNPDTPDTGPFPEEYRVEVYVPPYLASGQIRPSYNISVTDWQYGGTFQITNVITHMSQNKRISLLAGKSCFLRTLILLSHNLDAAVSSTHGNSFVSFS